MTSKFGNYFGSRVQFRRSRQPSWLRASSRVVKRTTTDETGVEVQHDLQLALLKPTQSYRPTQDDVLIFSNSTQEEVELFLSHLRGPVALDIETTGVNAEDPEQYVVGIGLCDDQHIAYFDFETNPIAANDALLTWISTYEPGFLLYNSIFECAWFLAKWGINLNVAFDCYGAYRHLSQEGYPGQKWGLKSAQVDLLGWKDQGDILLDEWLIRNKYISGPHKSALSGQELLALYKSGEAKFRADKSKMSLAPPEILGYYCGLDVASTYQLYLEVFLPSMDGEVWAERYMEYHDVYLDNTKLLAENQLAGIPVDREGLIKYNSELVERIEQLRLEFFAHPDVAAACSDYAAEQCKPLMRKLEKGPPEKFKKNGEISKNYLNYWEKVQELRESAELNLNSTDDLAWLFYTKLGYPVQMTTNSGKPSTGADALPGLGEPGRLLKRYKDVIKLQGYVEACINLLRQGDDGVWRLHPHYKAPGTLTGRLAGAGGVNVQQFPKDYGYLAHFRPDPNSDQVWVNMDVTSLENVVLAELSRDESMLKLYGPDAPDFQDAYLFNASQLPIIGPKIQAAGYDPDRPTEKSVAKVKRECKRERDIGKLLTLSANYGAGPGKIHQSLNLKGMELTFEEARELHGGFWKLYSGIKEWERSLRREYEANNMCLINGIGRPVMRCPDLTKDLVNAVGQSTGHDLLMYYICILRDLLERANIEWQPVILDWHDQVLLSCRREDAERVQKIMTGEAFTVLNELIQGLIPLSGDADIVENMAEAKELKPPPRQPKGDK